MINTLLDHGNPNPYVSDHLGKAPIHIAAAKLDRVTFEKLVASGSDPMMPDADGNTFLHYMAEGTIKDTEYDFIRKACIQHKLRLSRNKKGRTALNTIKAHSAQSASLRGQPNFKKKIWEFFESCILQNENFEDRVDDSHLHEMIRANDDDDVVINHLDKINTENEECQDESMKLLESRNQDGKTSFILAAELD